MEKNMKLQSDFENDEDIIMNRHAPEGSAPTNDELSVPATRDGPLVPWYVSTMPVTEAEQQDLRKMGLYLSYHYIPPSPVYIKHAVLRFREYFPGMVVTDKKWERYFTRLLNEQDRWEIAPPHHEEHYYFVLNGTQVQLFPHEILSQPEKQLKHFACALHFYVIGGKWVNPDRILDLSMPGQGTSARSTEPQPSSSGQGTSTPAESNNRSNDGPPAKRLRRSSHEIP